MPVAHPSNAPPPEAGSDDAERLRRLLLEAGWSPHAVEKVAPLVGAPGQEVDVLFGLLGGLAFGRDVLRERELVCALEEQQADIERRLLDLKREDDEIQARLAVARQGVKDAESRLASHREMVNLRLARARAESHPVPTTGVEATEATDPADVEGLLAQGHAPFSDPSRPLPEALSRLLSVLSIDRPMGLEELAIAHYGQDGVRERDNVRTQLRLLIQLGLAHKAGRGLYTRGSVAVPAE